MSNWTAGELAIAATFTLLSLVMLFGFHGGACAMHMAAAEDFWARHPDATAYRWSHAYCRVLSAPIRTIIP